MRTTKIKALSLPNKVVNMIVTFEEKYLQELFETGKTEDKIQINGIDPRMIANNLAPSKPIHPGGLLKDEIEYRGISQKNLPKVWVCHIRF